MSPINYERIQVQVEIYEDEEPIPMHYNVLKFLGRVYQCKLKHIIHLDEEITESFEN